LKRFSLRTPLMVLIDAILINIAFYSALLLRFDGKIPNEYIHNFLNLSPYITATGIAALIFLRLYSRIWEYASINEMVSIVVASSCSILLDYFLVDLLVLPGLPLSVFVMSWIAIIVFIGASRIWWRLFRDYVLKVASPGRRVLIVGAGDAGALLVREIQNNHQLGLDAVAFVDDSPAKKGKMLLGLPVKGGRDQIPRLVEDLDIEEIIIAMPSRPGKEIREIVEICKKTKADTKILPSIYSSSTEGNMVSHLRDVSMEDLLGREPVKTDLMQISSYVYGKTILVTGAGGSIGSELCRQLIKYKPAQLIMVDNHENNLFEIEQEMASLQLTAQIWPELLDVRSNDRLEKVFARYKPQVVFHAAAYKHVPMMERHPELAINNNVMGTRNVAEMAHQHGTEVFILISTDKAVNPTSVMGASKRIAELLVKDINRRSQTRFAAVRFGNVLGSRGSVIPTFMKQIEKGGPVTVTHPEMTRYFMTIPESVELVIQAGALAKGGEIFVLDMGEPVKIEDLAKDLIRLSGYEPGQHIEISYTGIRPGEKLYEELFSSREEMAATLHERIFISQKPLDESYYGLFDKIVPHLSPPDKASALQIICTYIPEYRQNPSLDNNPAAEVIYLEERSKKRQVSKT